MNVGTPRAVTWLLTTARARSVLLMRRPACLSTHLSSTSSYPSSLRHQLPTLTLYTKPNCPLCDYARSALQPFMHRFQLEEVDIMEPQHSEWCDEYQYDIPVVHLNDDFVMWHRVNTELLEKKLAELDTSTDNECLKK